MKHILNRFFDKIYCVTVCDFYDRHELVKKQLAGIDYQWVFSPEARHLNIKSKLSQSECSLIIGHQMCVLDAKLNGHEKIAIWEDDGILNADQTIMENFFNHLPEDWESLYMANASWNIGIYDTRTAVVNSHVNRITWGTGSGFNAIRHRVFDEFMTNSNRFCHPIDYTYYDIFNRLKSYSPANGYFSDPISSPNENCLHKFSNVERFLPSRIKHGQ